MTYRNPIGRYRSPRADRQAVIRRYHHSLAALHETRREGDEMACRCGRRWPIGEAHP